ncbi:MAG: TetR/AcrR family transcriptional regulator [Pseudomonadota bacterium]
MAPTPIADARSPSERIVEAGRRLFFEKGFQNVSTDMLAREAKVSKASIYKYFPDMAGILVAVTSAEAVHFFAAEPVVIDSRETLRSELIRFGTALLRFLNRSEIIRFTQLMFEQARENHEAAGQFYDAAYGATLEQLAALIRQGQEIDALNTSQSAEDLAVQLVGMWEFIPMVRVHMGKTKKPFAAPEVWATKCVDTLIP